MKQFCFAKASRPHSFRYHLYAATRFTFLKQRLGALQFRSYLQLIFTLPFLVFTITAFSNFEDHRYFDLARIGKVSEVMGESVLPVFPIPVNQITASSGAITQYPGY